VSLAVPFRERLLARIEVAGLDAGSGAFPALSEVQISRLEQYFDRLRHWNRRINLTALPLDPLEDRTIDRLFVEPLGAARFIGEGARWADLGSGGGSPAVPLKVACPSAHLTMVEPRTRKAAFLREAARALGLTGVTVSAIRAEALAARAPAAFDRITVRAVRLEAPFLAAVRSLLGAGGRAIAFLPLESSVLLSDFALIEEVRLPNSRVAIFEPFPI
jgi:16S rRNA (guanine527-N7)-methyltransferase